MTNKYERNFIFYFIDEISPLIICDLPPKLGNYAKSGMFCLKS